MNVLKNTALAFLTLASNATFAGSMGPICTEGNVTVPCASPAWDIGVQALYLKPAYSQKFLEFGAPDVAGITNLKGIDSNWGWGFKLEGSYHYTTANDLNLNWYHLNITTNDTITTLNTASTPVNLSTTFNPKWDAVNAEFGQLIQFSESKKIRFHGGAQYVQISHTFSDNVATLLPEQIYMKYYGFGPRFGADMGYLVGKGFGVYANGAAALLVGRNSFSTTGAGSIAAIGSTYKEMTSVIPELEGKLGANYTYLLREGNLSLDVGYLWLNYIQSQSFAFKGTVNGESDFTLNGPYIGLKWLGSV